MTAPDPQLPAQAAQEPPRLDDGPFVPPAPLLPGERPAEADGGLNQPPIGSAA